MPAANRRRSIYEADEIFWKSPGLRLLLLLLLLDTALLHLCIWLQQQSHNHCVLWLFVIVIVCDCLWLFEIVIVWDCDCLWLFEIVWDYLRLLQTQKANWLNRRSSSSTSRRGRQCQAAAAADPTQDFFKIFRPPHKCFVSIGCRHLVKLNYIMEI